MISNEKVINYRVVVLIEIYNFGCGCFFIRDHLQNLNFKIFELQIQI
jgi:hypothetical protein